MNEKISVIVPAYNTEQYIEKCVSSILNQSYPDIEIIIVDDGSTDSSLKIAEELAVKYKGRIIVIHKENGGLSSARNCGIDHASGDYLCFIDSDDWIDQNMLEGLHRVLTDTQSDVACCSFYYEKQTKANSFCYEEYRLPIGKHAVISVERDEYLSDFNKYALTFLIISCNKLYKKTVFDRVRFAEGKRCEDELVFHRILDASRKISVINEPYYYYYMSQGSITRGNDSWKNIVFVLEAYRMRREFFFKEGYKKSYEQSECDYVTSLMKDWKKIKEINFERSKSELRYLKSIYSSIRTNSMLSNKMKLLIRLFVFFPNYINAIFYS